MKRILFLLLVCVSTAGAQDKNVYRKAEPVFYNPILERERLDKLYAVKAAAEPITKAPELVQPPAVEQLAQVPQGGVKLWATPQPQSSPRVVPVAAAQAPAETVTPSAAAQASVTGRLQLTAKQVKNLGIDITNLTATCKAMFEAGETDSQTGQYEMAVRIAVNLKRKNPSAFQTLSPEARDDLVRLIECSIELMQ